LLVTHKLSSVSSRLDGLPATDADRLTTAAGEVSCELEYVRTCLGVHCHRSAQVREQEHEQEREQERGTGVALARASGKIRCVESLRETAT
jgi:hypothetical protein